MGDTRFSSEKFEKLCIVIIAILFFIVVFKTITSPKKIYTVSLPEKNPVNSRCFPEKVGNSVVFCEG